MQTITAFLVLVALCMVSFFLGRTRSQLIAKTRGGASLHSLPKHYGYMAAAWAFLPAIAILLVWTGLESNLIYNSVISGLPPEVRALSADQLGLYYNQLQSFALNQIDEFGLDEAQVAAAQHYRELSASLAYKKTIVVL